MGIIFHENNCRAYDRAAIKFRGLDADINFQVADYEDEIKHVSDQSKNVLALLPYIHTHTYVHLTCTYIRPSYMHII